MKTTAVFFGITRTGFWSKQSMNDKLDYDLTCWYLNLRRVAELVGNLGLSKYLDSAKPIAEVGDIYARLALLSAGKDAIIEWLVANNPETLGQLLLSNKVKPGKVFTHYSNFYCKGLQDYRKAKAANSNAASPPEIYSKLDSFIPAARLIIKYYPEHLTSESSQEILSGQRQLFVFGIIDSITDDVTIHAIPYVFATLLPELGKASIKGMRWSNRLEVFVDGVDSFTLVKNEPRPKAGELSSLKDVPEEAVKYAFAEIIGEPNVPKDWGGEKSDLFSANVVLDGERISTAFAFKGPSKFKPMTLAECGKKGNQIGRLFSEPADLLVLQHCHEITPDVREAMRAFATRIGNPRLFLLIDGYDTIRVLRTYGKCGFTSTPVTQGSLQR